MKKARINICKKCIVDGKKGYVLNYQTHMCEFVDIDSDVWFFLESEIFLKKLEDLVFILQNNRITDISIQEVVKTAINDVERKRNEVRLNHK